MARQKFSLKNAEQVRQTTTMSQQKEICIEKNGIYSVGLSQQKQVVLSKTTCFCNFLPHLPPHHYLPSALTANKILPDHLSQEDSFFITANMALISYPALPPPSHNIFSPYSVPDRFVWRGWRTP